MMKLVPGENWSDEIREAAIHTVMDKYLNRYLNPWRLACNALGAAIHATPMPISTSRLRRSRGM